MDRLANTDTLQAKQAFEKTYAIETEIKATKEDRQFLKSPRYSENQATIYEQPMPDSQKSAGPV